MKKVKKDLFKKFEKSQLSNLAQAKGGADLLTRVNSTPDKSSPGETRDDIVETSKSADSW